MKNLKNVGIALSRNEMRNVNAGLTDGGGIGSGGGAVCGGSCILYSNGTNSPGTCVSYFKDKFLWCGCHNSNGTAPTCRGNF